MTRLFAPTILLSATLLFMLQPLAGRVLLPVLGGSPAVWSACLVFFQTVLLFGYLYAHGLSRLVSPRAERWTHAALLVVTSLLLPPSNAVGAPGDADPRWWALETLARTVGLPFFALSATAPLLQHWFARAHGTDGRDPYFLYAVSNAGSLVGLVAYVAIEPLASRSTQLMTWTIGFWVVAALLLACASASLIPLPPKPRRRRDRPIAVVPFSQRVRWVWLALVPSALLVGVTAHLSNDVVSAPLMWTVPLAVYLGTFMAAFRTGGSGLSSRWAAVAPAGVLLVLVLTLGEVRYPLLPVALAHLAAFTVLAMMCHARLAETRPAPEHLTGYFVYVSLGGILGSALATLVAPAVFSSVLEYPLAIGAALFLRTDIIAARRNAAQGRFRWVQRAIAVTLLAVGMWSVSAVNERPGVSGGQGEATTHLLRAALAIPAGLLLFTSRTALAFAGATTGLLVGASFVRTGGPVLYRERTFFGVHQVTSEQDGAWHVLTHGTTTHGIQATRGKMRALPSAYYHPSGPLGDLVFTLSPDGRLRDIAGIGLGAGALAAYAGAGARVDFFEIDAAVVRIAEDSRFFTYLADARARPGTTVRTTAIDGRLGMAAAPLGSYDLIVVDAFSSDAIPTHLITREAVALYQSRLKPRGVIAFHVSSRYFDLRPVLARLALDGGLVCYARDDQDVPSERAAEAMRRSTWVVLASAEQDLGQLVGSAPRWARIVGNPRDRVWVDDYTPVLSALTD